MLLERDRTAQVKTLGEALAKDVAVQFPSASIPDGATVAWVFVDRTNILGTKVRALVRIEMSLDGGKSWGGMHRVESRDKFKEPAIEYPLSLELWIDGVDATPPGMSKDSGFGVELPDLQGRLIRSIVRCTATADVGIYYKFDDPPKRVWADLSVKNGSRV